MWGRVEPRLGRFRIARTQSGLQRRTGSQMLNASSSTHPDSDHQYRRARQDRNQANISCARMTASPVRSVIGQGREADGSNPAHDFPGRLRCVESVPVIPAERAGPRPGARPRNPVSQSASCVHSGRCLPGSLCRAVHSALMFAPFTIGHHSRSPPCDTRRAPGASAGRQLAPPGACSANAAEWPDPPGSPPQRR